MAIRLTTARARLLQAYRVHAAVLIGSLAVTVMAMYYVATVALEAGGRGIFPFRFGTDETADYSRDAFMLRVIGIMIDPSSGEAQVEELEVSNAQSALKPEVIAEALKDEAAMRRRLELLGRSAGPERVGVVSAALPGLVAPPAAQIPTTPSATQSPSETPATGPTGTSGPLVPVAAQAPVLIPPTQIPPETPVEAAATTPPTVAVAATLPPTRVAAQTAAPASTEVAATSVPAETPVPTAPLPPEPTNPPRPTNTPRPTATPIPATTTAGPTATPGPTATAIPENVIIAVDAPAIGFIGASSMTPGTAVTRIVTVHNTGTLPFNTYTLSTSPSGAVTALWSDPAGGLQLRVRRGRTVIYEGTIAVTGLNLGATLGPGGIDALEITVYLPTTAPDSIQGLSQTLAFTWTATGG